MLNVLLTVDTEAWPAPTTWPAIPLAGNDAMSTQLAHFVYGATPTGEFGIRYQIARLDAYGLKATFFVEALSADAIGHDELSRLIATIEEGSQEVQLQIHTEWMGELHANGLPRTWRQHLREFDYADQCRIIGYGLENLHRCGARNVVALRAGNFGADLQTLRAAGANGLRFDSSHSVAYFDAACGLSSLGPLLAPCEVEGVVEVPLSFFSDYANHYRPAQLCACSFDELRDALLFAWREGWPCFVVLLHSFELMKNFRNGGRGIGPHAIHLARFEKICGFLADNRDKFETTHFRDFVPRLDAAATPRPMPGSVRRTLYRYGEQALGRLI